jgi:glycosyltransferase involved in cell wall biosynthesis
MGRTDWDRRVCSVLSPASTYYHCEEIIRDTFFKQQWSQSVQKEKVLFSTIQPNIYKGLETVLETAVLLKKILPFSFVWKIAGISPEHSIVKMFERKKGARFSENGVELCGSLGLEALVEHELKADLFIHPSHIDNSPNSVCEAMLLGLPVIATASGGTGSLLNDGEEGILIQDGDPFAMAGAISELLENTEKATAMGIAARKRAMLRHDPVKVSATLFDTYRLILEAEAKK